MKIKFVKVVAGIVLLCLILLLFLPYGREIKYLDLTQKTQIFKNDSTFIESSITENNIYYYCFIKDSLQKGFQKKKISIKDVLLVEKDTIPTLEKKVLLKKNRYKYLFSSDTYSEEFQEYDSGIFNKIPLPENTKYKYTLILPKGSITNKIYGYELLNK